MWRERPVPTSKTCALPALSNHEQWHCKQQATLSRTSRCCAAMTGAPRATMVRSAAWHADASMRTVTPLPDHLVVCALRTAGKGGRSWVQHAPDEHPGRAYRKHPHQLPTLTCLAVASRQADASPSIPARRCTSSAGHAAAKNHLRLIAYLQGAVAASSHQVGGDAGEGHVVDGVDVAVQAGGFSPCGGVPQPHLLVRAPAG